MDTGPNHVVTNSQLIDLIVGMCSSQEAISMVNTSTIIDNLMTETCELLIKRIKESK